MNTVFNQQREKSISFFLILDIVLVVMLIALLFPESVWAAGSHVRSCSSVDWELGGNEHSNQENWRGVRGDNNVQNYYATGLHINSVDIWANSAYHAEWGWHIEGTTRDLNVWVREGGQVIHTHPGTPSIGTREFTLWNNGDGHFYFYLDGVSMDDRQISFISGIPRVFRENHNSCNSGYAHWWDLEKCPASGPCSFWGPNHSSWDTDPDWNFRWLSNTEWDNVSP